MAKSFEEELRGLRSCNEESDEEFSHPADMIPKAEPGELSDAGRQGSASPHRPTFKYNDVDMPAPARLPRLDYSDMEQGHYRGPPQYRGFEIAEPTPPRKLKTPERTQTRRIKTPPASQATNPAFNRITKFIPQGSPIIDLTQEPIEQRAGVLMEEDLIMLSPVLSARERVDDDPRDLMMLIDELDGEIANTQHTRYETSQAVGYLGLQAQPRQVSRSLTTMDLVLTVSARSDTVSALPARSAGSAWW
jgi:hypothetical protein